MGIFDFLKSKKSGSEEYIVREERKAECPYCHKVLDKIPGKKTCGQMANCEEAYFYLNNCGVGGLDRDKDGIPCETICN